MRANGVEAVIARYREAGTKKDARNFDCAHLFLLGVLLYLGVLGGTTVLANAWQWH